MPRFWFSDVTVTRLRLRVRTVSCAWWNVPGLLRSMPRVFGIRRGVRRSVLNAAAARSYLPRTIKKTDLILAGRTKAQMVEAIAAAVDSALPTEVRKGEKGITLCMPMPFTKATQTDGVQEETAEEQTCYAFCFRAYWLCSHRARGRTVNQGRSRQFKSVESATLSKSPRELSCDPIWAEL